MTAAPRPRSERSAAAWRTLGLAALAALGIALTQGRAAATVQYVKETTDVYVLPPPDEVVTLSLGYRAALADFLWAHVLVSQGLHLFEKRRYDNVTRLIDAINALDPTFREPYLLADTLITFQIGKTPHDEVVKAREILERGAKNRPFDAEVWLALGEFVAYLAPAGYLDDPDERARWRVEGAQYLSTAAELSGPDSNVAWRTLGGANILFRAGERDATIHFLERALAVTDDEELRRDLEGKLAKLIGESEADAYKRRQRDFQNTWRHELPFVDKTMFLVLGPPPDPAYCAGTAHTQEARCALTWRDWAERISSEHPPDK